MSYLFRMAFRFRARKLIEGVIALAGTIGSVMVRRWVRESPSVRMPPEITVSVPPGARGRATTHFDLHVLNRGPVAIIVSGLCLLAPRRARLGIGRDGRLPHAIAPAGPENVSGVIHLVANALRTDLHHGRLLVEYAWQDRPKDIVAMPVRIFVGDVGFYDSRD